jgi:hypothetical protein
MVWGGISNDGSTDLSPGKLKTAITVACS